MTSEEFVENCKLTGDIYFRQDMDKEKKHEEGGLLHRFHPTDVYMEGNGLDTQIPEGSTLSRWFSWLKRRLPELDDRATEFYVKQAFSGYSEYWQKRCLLAENALNESPCDPDITDSQIRAHRMHDYFKENDGLNLTKEIRDFFKGLK